MKEQDFNVISLPKRYMLGGFLSWLRSRPNLTRNHVVSKWCHDGMMVNRWATKKKNLYWLIGILIMAYYNPRLTVQYNPLYNPTNQVFFFVAQVWTCLPTILGCQKEMFIYCQNLLSLQTRFLHQEIICPLWICILASNNSPSPWQIAMYVSNIRNSKENMDSPGFDLQSHRSSVVFLGVYIILRHTLTPRKTQVNRLWWFPTIG